MYTNYHTHTFRCNHASGREVEYVENAIKSGIKILGFSDHAPMPFKGRYYSDFRMKLNQAEDYVRTVENLRDEYKDDIKIYIGFEAEYYPEVFQRYLDFISQFDYDYMIMGQHFLDNEKKSHYNGGFTDVDEYLIKYVNQVIEGLSTGKFSYLAHPDLMDFKGSMGLYTREMTRLCQFAKKADIPLEINFLGIREGRHYPNEFFWEIAGKEGCKAIFGVDAHSPRDLLLADGALERAEDIAKKYGLERVHEIKLLK